MDKIVEKGKSDPQRFPLFLFFGTMSGSETPIRHVHSKSVRHEAKDMSHRCLAYIWCELLFSIARFRFVFIRNTVVTTDL